MNDAWYVYNTKRGCAQIIDDQLRDVHETPGRHTALQDFVVEFPVGGKYGQAIE
jgi:hypothetical protein